MTEVYAYLRGKKGELEERSRKQRLKQHIKDSIEALENEIKNTKIWKYYVKMSEYDEETVEKWIRFIITFHDIGKMFYQRNFRPYKDEVYLNFTGHEFISTFLADKFLGIWLERDIENRISEYRDFRWIICASILYHHHAMGLKSRERLNEIKVCKDRNEFKEIVKNVYRILQNYLEGFEDNVILPFVDELKNFKLMESDKYNTLILDQNVISDIFRYVDELNVKIWENFVDNESFRRQMILTINILITADYKGSEGRGEEKTKFGAILDEFLSLYRLITVKDKIT